MDSSHNVSSIGKFAGDERRVPDDVLAKARDCKHILFVDDQLCNHFMLLGYIHIRDKKYVIELQKQKVAVISGLPNDVTLYLATSGLKGIELYKEYKPDLILTDYNMLDADGTPGMSGDEMLVNIHFLANEYKQNDPVYMMCSSESKAILEQEVIPPLREASIECKLIGAGDAKYLLGAILKPRAELNPENTPSL